MVKELNIEIEKAIRLLVESLPISDKNSKKPILAHDIRVGMYLYKNDCSRDIVLAGILHDALEFSDIGEQKLQDEFGKNVARIVRACTKKKTIEDDNERIDELVLRCSREGTDALIVRAADILDSFKYYTQGNNPAELLYCRKNSEAIFKYMPNGFKDKVLDELKEWYKK
ncbi:MAG: HD domain-containing protein [Candidatus Omnitrophica bacterium]|nr:HD domain-containing protein [Candidatus Omnitrophota bacterium]MBU2028373.1 HD domain-containing protein [Patescibacteria group bacterium]